MSCVPAVRIGRTMALKPQLKVDILSFFLHI